MTEECGGQVSGNSPATGNRTPVSRVTGGDTSHYTMTDAPYVALLLYIIFEANKVSAPTYNFQEKSIISILKFSSFFVVVLRVRTPNKVSAPT